MINIHTRFQSEQLNNQFIGFDRLSHYVLRRVRMSLVFFQLTNDTVDVQGRALVVDGLISPGWWFGTCVDYDFPYIGNVIIPTDFNSIIFQRG